MNKLARFDFRGEPIRTLTRNNEQWWVAADVCKALALSNPTKTLSSLDSDEKHTLTITEGIAKDGRAQALSIVNESGLYSLILRSRKPQAKEFKRWITHEVLPAIRLNGGYISPAASAAQLSGLIDTIKEQAEENALLKSRCKQLSAALGNCEPYANTFGAISGVTMRPRLHFRRSYWKSDKRSRTNSSHSAQLLLGLFIEREAMAGKSRQVDA